MGDDLRPPADNPYPTFQPKASHGTAEKIGAPSPSVEEQPAAGRQFHCQDQAGQPPATAQVEEEPFRAVSEDRSKTVCVIHVRTHWSGPDQADALGFEEQGRELFVHVGNHPEARGHESAGFQLRGGEENYPALGSGLITTRRRGSSPSDDVMTPSMSFAES
ncbi:MAG: hypothetical protein M3011_07095 [Actinomycetota bacterium]|nr:hypothetical protein [Actinomycetota bacterium]